MTEQLTAPAVPLVVHQDEATTTLTLDRPHKRNSLSAELVEELLEAVSAAESDGTRLLVLRGNGRSFSAGFDFSSFREQSDGDLLHRFVRIETLLQRVAHSPLATLALVHGPTFGAGADLVVACDQRVLDPGASVRMPGFRFGLALGTRRLAHRVGADAARRILERSSTLSADEAHEVGLATDVVPQDDWDDLITERGREAALLTPSAAARLYHCVTPDTRAADMAELVNSAAEPGLVDRIHAFREESK